MVDNESSVFYNIDSRKILRKTSPNEKSFKEIKISNFFDENNNKVTFLEKIFSGKTLSKKPIPKKMLVKKTSTGYLEYLTRIPIVVENNLETCRGIFYRQTDDKLRTDEIFTPVTPGNTWECYNEFNNLELTRIERELRKFAYRGLKAIEYCEQKETQSDMQMKEDSSLGSNKTKKFIKKYFEKF